MASEAEKAVVYAYLRGQLDAAHEAIVNIWKVMHCVDTGVLSGEDLDEAIDNALRCLPAEKRLPEMGDLDAPRKEFGRKHAETTTGFDDILGA